MLCWCCSRFCVLKSTEMGGWMAQRGGPCCPLAVNLPSLAKQCCTCTATSWRPSDKGMPSTPSSSRTANLQKHAETLSWTGWETGGWGLGDLTGGGVGGRWLCLGSSWEGAWEGACILHGECWIAAAYLAVRCSRHHTHKEAASGQCGSNLHSDMHVCNEVRLSRCLQCRACCAR